MVRVLFYVFVIVLLVSMVLAAATLITVGNDQTRSDALEQALPFMGISVLAIGAALALDPFRRRNQ